MKKGWRCEYDLQPEDGHHCLRPCQGFPYPPCVARLTMTPEQRAEVQREAAREEAEELELDASFAIFDGWAPALAAPVEASGVLANGGRFGRLVLLGQATYRRPSGDAMTVWRCRCDCGQETRVAAYRLRRGVSQCKACSNQATARAHTKRFGSSTVLELAAAAGLPWKTIWTRIRRGVPLEQLTAPRRRPPTNGGRRRAA